MITVIKEKYSKEYPPKYILGLLNSKLYYVWLKNKGKLKGNMLELYGAPLEELPVKTADNNTINEVVNIVNQLLEKPNDSYLEKQLDELVYTIFELTSEEKELVEKY